MAQRLIIGYHARASRISGRRNAIAGAYDIVRENMPEGVVEPCCAVFISGPRNQHVNITHADARAIGARDSGSVLFHAAYVDLPFSATSADDPVFARIAELVSICEEARADVVLHTSSRMFDDATCAIVLPKLVSIVAHRTPVAAAAASGPSSYGRIFLETMSFDARFANPRAINDVFERYIGHAPARIGVCVDTAHIWAAGADISSREMCSAWFDELGAFPVAIHLNDSYNTIGSHSDKHACLGEGEIWSNGDDPSGANDGYVAILEWAREHGSPVILERNGTSGDLDDEVARDLATIARKLNFE
jgi:endonuclease IV